MDGVADSTVAVEFLPLVRTFNSGRVERLIGTDVAPAAGDCLSGVSSKDVAISADVSARIFLPHLPDPSGKLPVVVYFHGGGFIIESPFSPHYHRYATALAAAAPALVVSVHYRRAPEHPLPAAYDDSWAALRWVAGHAINDGAGGQERWLIDHGDLDRIVVAGDSAGGNIAHHMAVRAGEDGALPAGSRVVGAALIHPFFWGSGSGGLRPETLDPTRGEGMEKFWRFVYPAIQGPDDELACPMEAGPPRAARVRCGVLVCVAETDFLKDCGRAYHDWLVDGGLKGSVEMMESKGEGHVFHLFNPEGDSAKQMMNKLVDFINRNE